MQSYTNEEYYFKGVLLHTALSQSFPRLFPAVPAPLNNIKAYRTMQY